MNDLVIQLTGEITDTNFEEWQKDLIERIEGINLELKTEEEFGIASHHVTELKKAELALKEAKQSAIEQAADIQKLFAAIDDVSDAARTARLALDKQIKTRKEEIKEEIVNGGISRIRSLIEEQNEDFQRLDTREYLDRSLWESTIKGKRGPDGMDAAVGLLVEKMTAEIADQAKAVDDRAIQLDRIEARHRPLFQDRGALLNLGPDELTATLAERIEVFEREQAALGEAAPAAGVAEEAPAATTGSDLSDLDVDFMGGSDSDSDAGETAQPFVISLHLLATGAEAKALRDEVDATFVGRDTVQKVVLENA